MPCLRMHADSVRFRAYAGRPVSSGVGQYSSNGSTTEPEAGSTFAFTAGADESPDEQLASTSPAATADTVTATRRRQTFTAEFLLGVSPCTSSGDRGSRPLGDVAGMTCNRQNCTA